MLTIINKREKKDIYISQEFLIHIGEFLGYESIKEVKLVNKTFYHTLKCSNYLLSVFLLNAFNTLPKEVHARKLLPDRSVVMKFSNNDRYIKFFLKQLIWNKSLKHTINFLKIFDSKEKQFTEFYLLCLYTAINWAKKWSFSSTKTIIELVGKVQQSFLYKECAKVCVENDKIKEVNQFIQFTDSLKEKAYSECAILCAKRNKIEKARDFIELAGSLKQVTYSQCAKIIFKNNDIKNGLQFIEKAGRLKNSTLRDCIYILANAGNTKKAQGLIKRLPKKFKKTVRCNCAYLFARNRDVSIEKKLIGFVQQLPEKTKYNVLFKCARIRAELGDLESTIFCAEQTKEKSQFVYEKCAEIFFENGDEESFHILIEKLTEENKEKIIKKFEMKSQETSNTDIDSFLELFNGSN